MSEQLHAASRMIEHYAAIYGALALFVIICLESIGAPLPGESALVASSLLAARGDLPLSHAMAAAFLGAVLGDNIGYLIGRRFGRRVLQRYGPKLGLTEARQQSLEAQFRLRGFFLVATARFVVLLRQLNGLLAGTVAMPWPRFLVANCFGAGLWTLVWTLGPYFFADVFTGLKG